jgi:hypothetical protein
MSLALATVSQGHADSFGQLRFRLGAGARRALQAVGRDRLDLAAQGQGSAGGSLGIGGASHQKARPRGRGGRVFL